MKAHHGSSRRLPKLSYRVIEESNNHDVSRRYSIAGIDDELPVSNRRSNHTNDNEIRSMVVESPLSSSSSRRNFRNDNSNININRQKLSYNKREGVRKNNGNENSMKSGTSEDPTRKDAIFWGFIKTEENTEDPVTTLEKLEAKLQSSITFRVNIITMFGQLLNAPDNKLNIGQYKSLDLILEALVLKQVYMFNTLPILKKLQGAKIETQFRLVILALMNNVPGYLTSSCKYFLNEIDKYKIDIENIFSSIKYPGNFLTGIDPEAIDTCKIKVAADELEPFDNASELTKLSLGPVFVNIFYKIKNRKIKLSQKLFAAILVNLPIGNKPNPVFEEYINYVWEIAQNDLLVKNWDEIVGNVDYGNPYEVVKFVIEKLSNQGNITSGIRHAFQYIMLHLKETPNSYNDEYHEDMKRLLNDENAFDKLLAMIPDDPNFPEQSDLRDELIVKITRVNIDTILQGMNKYVYKRPIDLLIGILTRIEGRVRDKEIYAIVTRLKSIIVFKDDFESLTGTVSENVDFITLLNFLNVPKQTNPWISDSVEEIKQYLDNNAIIIINIQKLIPKDDKLKCRRPIQCLMFILEEIVDPDNAEQLEIPSDLITVIKILKIQIQAAIDSSVKCKPKDTLSMENVDDFTIRNYSNVITLTSSTPTVSSSEENFSLEEIRPTTESEKKTEVEIDDDKKSTTSPIPLNSREEKPTDSVELTTISEPISSSGPSTKPSTPYLEKIPDDITTTLHSFPVDETHTTELHQQTDNEEPVLPPNLKYDRPIYIVFPKDDGPAYTLFRKPNAGLNIGAVSSLPSMKDLMKELNPDDHFDPSELPDIPEIMEPLRKIFGSNFVEIILDKHINKAEYPTVVSLINDLLDHALGNPNVIADIKLVALIRQYLKSLDYIIMTALFPVVIDSQKITSDILYIAFDFKNPNAYNVHSERPTRLSSNFVILPIWHPKYWIKKIDTLNPYGNLLPSFIENPVQELIDDDSLEAILGKDFNPMIYPNRGTLLMTVLQRLVLSTKVKAKPLLMKKLNGYLKSIKTVAIYNKIPNDYTSHILELQHNNEVNWQPDTASLIVALPRATNHEEYRMMNLIRSFLGTQNLLEMLKIPNPSYSTTRGALLKMIFNAAIRGNNKMILDQDTLSALTYFKSRIMNEGYGALPIVWIWVQMFIIREEIPLGDIIEAVLDYDKLPHGIKLAYNQVMTYLSENPRFLQSSDEFPYDKYNTKGTFLRGLFSHLISKVGVSPKIKRHIKKLIPYVVLHGRGAERMNHVTLDDIANGAISGNGYTVMLDV